MKKNEFLHQVAMGTIVVGSLVLLYSSYIWFTRNNILMGIGMLVMGLIAISNFYLHRRMM